MFGCPWSLKSDPYSHFINETVQALLQNFMMKHHKRTPYHPKANGTIEAFNKILEKGLTNVFYTNKDDYDERVPATLWAYWTIVKWFQKYIPFELVYGKEFVIPVEFIIPNIFVSHENEIS